MQREEGRLKNKGREDCGSRTAAKNGNVLKESRLCQVTCCNTRRFPEVLRLASTRILQQLVLYLKKALIILFYVPCFLGIASPNCSEMNLSVKLKLDYWVFPKMSKTLKDVPLVLFYVWCSECETPDSVRSCQSTFLSL